MISDSFIFGILGSFQAIISLIAYNNYSEGTLFANVIIYWFCSVIYAYRGKQNTIVYLFFLITFFVFLLGKDIFIRLLGFETTILGSSFSDNTMCFIYFVMFLSLFSMSWGVILFRPKIKRITFPFGNEKRFLMKQVILKIYYITIGAKYILTILNVYNAIVYGYGVNAVSNGISTPYILLKLSQFADISFIGFLLLAPSKKELKLPIILYILVLVLSLLSGVRGDMMYPLVVLFMYLLFRDYISSESFQLKEKFLTKKLKLAIVIILPFLLIFLSLFANIRLGNKIESTGLIKDLSGFFIQQGGSYNVIGYVKEYKDVLPSTNISYTFGPFLDRLEPLQSNYLEPDPKSYEAVYGNNLGATITWFVDPYYYYNGGGLGSQYIAELYADFGYVGVVFFSFILGIVMSKAIFFSIKNWILCVLFASSIRVIIEMPRSFYLNFVQNILSIWNIIFLLILNTYVNYRMKNNKSVAPL